MTDHPESDPAGRPQDGQSRIDLQFDHDLAMRLAAFIGRNSEFAGRPDAAARHILRLWLTEHGYDGAHADAGTPPDRLNASNDD